MTAPTATTTDTDTDTNTAPDTDAIQALYDEAASTSDGVLITCCLLALGGDLEDGPEWAAEEWLAAGSPDQMEAVLDAL